MKFIGDKMKSIIITKTGEILKYDSVLEAQSMLNEIAKQYGKEIMEQYGEKGKLGYFEMIAGHDKVRIYDVSYELRLKSPQKPSNINITLK